MPTHGSASLGASSGPPSGRMMPPPSPPLPPWPPWAPCPPPPAFAPAPAPLVEVASSPVVPPQPAVISSRGTRTEANARERGSDIRSPYQTSAAVYTPTAARLECLHAWYPSFGAGPPGHPPRPDGGRV